MTASLAQLEAQLSRLDALNKASVRAVDAFADTAHAIATRARAITRDIQPWQVAQDNVARTMGEAARAARCYHAPAYLPRVLARHDRDVAHVVRCIDYLVYADNYLAGHAAAASDGVEAAERDAMALRTHTQLTTMVHVSEEFVRAAFIAALQKTATATTTSARRQDEGNNSNDNNATTTTLLAPGRIVRHPDALRGVDAVVQRLGENFNRTAVVQHDVRRMLEERLRTAVLAQFDGTYRDEEEHGMARSRVATATGVSLLSSSRADRDDDSRAATATSSRATAAVMRHYQCGEHRLLGISRTTRAMVREVAACVHAYILVPLDDDYAVTEMAGELATVAFDLIAERARRAIAFDVHALRDVARVLVELRGQDYSLCPAPRCLRDVVFVGCDVVRELWQWKVLAAQQLPGDARACIDHVDRVIDDYLARLRDVLEAYVNAKGTLDAASLKAYTSALRRSEWLAARDAAPHEMTANVLYFHKVLLTSYYGALKLVLCGVGGSGSCAGVAFSESDDDAAVVEVEDFVVRSVLGTLQDLHTIAQVTIELQDEQQKQQQPPASSSSLSPLAYAQLPRQLMHGDVKLRDGMVQRLTSPSTRLSREVFVINNVLLLEASYSREACFVTRCMRVEANANDDKDAVAIALAASQPSPPPQQQQQQRRRHKQQQQEEQPAVVLLPVVTHARTALAQERERCIVDFGASWRRCFPRLDLAAADSRASKNNNSSTSAPPPPPLRSAERMTVKRWHKHVTRALRDRVRDGKSQVVLDASVRTRLLDAAVGVVQDAFAQTAALLRGRAWSRHPRKWSPYDVDEWVAQMRTMF